MSNLVENVDKNNADIVEEQVNLFDEFDDLDFDFNDEKEEMGTKDNSPFYELVNNQSLKEGEEPLGRVIGHENQKKELLLVIDWFKRSGELRKRGISIPKGVILFGAPGNGKSLLIKEIIRCCDAPVFIFQGEQKNVVEGICETFKKAREAGHAIIVFDELDLLINKERRVIRALQENLDGVESLDDILVLAATNYMNEIPKPLLRNGRLEKIIEIPYPNGKESIELLKKYFKDFDVALPKDFDEEEVALSLDNITCAGIKAVVNDVVLRNGFENITTEMIDNSIYSITNRVKESVGKENMDVSIHECGHALMVKAFPQYFYINRITISGPSGLCQVKEVEEDFWPYEKVIADIKIAMAGTIAQKLICGTGSRGVEIDLQRARMNAYNMFTMNGYSSCWETLPPVREGARTDTYIKRRKMERKIEKLLKKCEKETYKYIKAHVEDIKKLAKLLFEKKRLKSTEILSAIG